MAEVSPLCAVPIGFSMVFPDCQANVGIVTPKGTWTDFAKRTLATQGCGRAVKFCLCPVLNPRLGTTVFFPAQRCVSYAGMETAWRTSSRVIRTCDSASGSLLLSCLILIQKFQFFSYFCCWNFSSLQVIR